MKKIKASAAATGALLAVMTASVSASAAVIINSEDYHSASAHVLGTSAVTSGRVDFLDGDGDGYITATDLSLIKRALVVPANDVSNNDVTSVEFSQSSLTLKNSTGDIVSAGNASNLTVSGTTVTITKPCELDISGECSSAKIDVNVDKSTYADGEVTLNLCGTTLSNQSDSPIYITALDGECAISAKNGTINNISDGSSYTNADGKVGAIYSCDDLKLKGKGTLIVNGNAGDAIVSKNDIKIWNGTIEVTAKEDGIRGKDSVRIGDPDDTDYSNLSVTVKAGADGIKSTNTQDEGRGFVRISGGTVNVNAQADGIQGDQLVEISGGKIDVYTYVGSGYTGSGSVTNPNDNPWGGGFGDNGNKNKVENSAKGIKASGILSEDGETYISGGEINISGGDITLDCSDDAVHSAGTQTISGGTLNIKTADDAIHSDGKLNITGGEINVTKSYEAVEGVDIVIDDGTLTLIASDDGINAAGGTDGSGNQNPWGGFGGFGGSSTGTLTINGGTIYLESNIDGIDSNGSLTINGGLVVSSAITSEGGAGPLDADGNTIFNGGEVIAIGGTGWVETPKDSSAQNSVRITLTSQNSGIIAICDSSGKVITAYEGTKPYQSYIYSSKSLVTGQTYSIYTGGSYSGGTNFHGTLSGGNYSPGTLVQSFTVSGKVTSVGSGGGWMW